VGYSLDEVLSKKQTVQKKAARQAEGIKGQKVEEVKESKTEKASTLIYENRAEQYAKTADSNNVLLGFGSVKEEVDPRGGRPQRGRGGNQAQASRQGGRRQNPKQALKLTEEDFPALA
jgi:hypothetical protein